jgi:hypothetical protein
MRISFSDHFSDEFLLFIFRVRREPRKPGDSNYERAALFALSSQTKAVIRNPTRYVPDVAGIGKLRKFLSIKYIFHFIYVWYPECFYNQ